MKRSDLQAGVHLPRYSSYNACKGSEVQSRDASNSFGRLTMMDSAVAAQLVFEEMQESAGPGPFMMQTMLKDPDGNMLYRPGIGTVSHPASLSHLA